MLLYSDFAFLVRRKLHRRGCEVLGLTLGAYEALEEALTANVNFQHPVEMSYFSTELPLLHLFSLATDK